MKPERTRHIALVAILALILVVVFCFARSGPRAVLPTYAGKTAQEWFYGVDGHPGREQTMKAARVAFEAMGTNCVPFLLDEVRRQETGLRKLYCWMYPQFPLWVRSRLRSPLRPYYTHMIALTHLRNMIYRLDYVASDLMAIVPRIIDDSTRMQAFHTVIPLVERIDDPGKKKAYFMAFLNDRDFRIQLGSAVELARLDDSLTNGIPILINAVTNKSLMDAAFPDILPGRLPWPQASARRKMAFEALNRVAPSLAEHYRTDRDLAQQVGTTNLSQSDHSATNRTPAADGPSPNLTHQGSSAPF